MRSKKAALLWSIIFSISFLFMETSLLLSPFAFFPTWLLYLFDVVLGLAIVFAVGDFRIGTFVDLTGSVIASVAYFWIGKLILQNFGYMSDLMASNVTLSSMVVTTFSLYLMSLLGNLIALILSGIA